MDIRPAPHHGINDTYAPLPVARQVGPDDAQGETKQGILDVVESAHHDFAGAEEYALSLYTNFSTG